MNAHSSPQPGSNCGPLNLPFNIEAEQGLLGALLLNNQIADQLLELEPEHFYDPVHARIYALAMGLITQGRYVSPVTLKPMVGNDDGLAELGGIDYLARLAGAAISIVAAPDFARSIRDLATRRDVQRIAEEMSARAAESFDASVDDILDGAERAITELRVREGDTQLVIPFQQALVSASNWANDAYQREGRPHISTGLGRLDELIGGLQRGRLYLLIGTSSMGKSALGIEMAGALMAQGHGALFASFEMPAAEIALRRVSAHLARKGIILPHFDIARGHMSEDQFRAYLEASRDMERQPFLTAEDGALEIGRLHAAMVRASKQLLGTASPLGAVFVDYLQLIKVPGVKERVTEVGHAVRELKHRAKEFNLPIVVLAQAKPEVEDRMNKRPGKRDIQWASEAHQAADAVIAVYRHEYYLAQAIAEAEGREKSELIADMHDCAGAVELIVSKQRGGPTGTALAYADLATNRFSDSRFVTGPAAADANRTEFGM